MQRLHDFCWLSSLDFSHCDHPSLIQTSEVIVITRMHMHFIFYSPSGTEPQTPSTLTISDIPPTMLTPLSSLSSPNTIDIGSTPISVTPAQSPTGIATPNPPATTDHSSKTRKSASTSSTGSNSSLSGQSAATTAKPPSGKVGSQPHPQLPHPQQPLPGQPPSSSSSSNESPSTQLQREGSATETGKIPGSGGGVAGNNAAVGRGGVAGSAAGGDHVTPSKTPAGIVTATALNQRQATHSTPNQGVCVCVERERENWCVHLYV